MTRHGVLTRATHWVRAAAVMALLGTGWLILLAHPRLYWGEDGYFADPALLDLGLAVDEAHLGWARGVHFLAAWTLVANGLTFLLAGGPLRLLRRSPYRPAQRVAYLGVLGFLLPTLVLSGLAMSPAVTAAHPWLFDLFGGRQSARTVHFAGAVLVALFTLGHMALALRGGLWRGMLTGRAEMAR